MNENNFCQSLVKAAATVMHCDYCRSQAPKGDQPQPGWVGSRYTPSRGVVVVLQNPGAAPTNYGSKRERNVQQLLRDIAVQPSIESHSRLMQFMLADTAGETGGVPCAQWTHPVRKLIPNREKLAWMNVVKFRTPGKGRKDDPVTQEAARHGATVHLQCELEILNPKAVITIGNEARSAVDVVRLPQTTIRGHLKLQGASTDEVLRLRQKLLNAGADI